MAIFGKNKAKTETKAKAQTTEAPAQSMKDLYSEDKPAKAVKAKAKGTGAVAGRVLVRPLVTEKATNLMSAGQYAFVVSSRANKIDVAKAVRAAYGVEPLAVNVISVQGKRVSRGRIQGRRKDWKKAIVTLAKGQTIKLYEGV